MMSTHGSDGATTPTKMSESARTLVDHRYRSPPGSGAGPAHPGMGHHAAMKVRLRQFGRAREPIGVAGILERPNGATERPRGRAGRCGRRRFPSTRHRRSGAPRPPSFPRAMRAVRCCAPKSALRCTPARRRVPPSSAGVNAASEERQWHRACRAKARRTPKRRPSPLAAWRNRCRAARRPARDPDCRTGFPRCSHSRRNHGGDWSRRPRSPAFAAEAAPAHTGTAGTP